eukprot:Seg1779.6 transcript_id=Seg1779.6/GoldUCD/mRNA.D3Y31 product="hypothetical protein" protein_id=Seg1779.6/GoldUCD/D3Y31
MAYAHSEGDDTHHMRQFAATQQSTVANNQQLEQNAPFQRVPFPDQPPGSYLVTLLRFCHEKTAACYGCSAPLKDLQGQIPPPPKDMVIVTKARRRYYDPNGMPREGKLGNVYFHFNVDCVKRKNNYFVPFLCQIQVGVREQLQPGHLQMIQAGGIPL